LSLQRQTGKSANGRQALFTQNTGHRSRGIPPPAAGTVPVPGAAAEPAMPAAIARLIVEQASENILDKPGAHPVQTVLLAIHQIKQIVQPVYCWAAGEVFKQKIGRPVWVRSRLSARQGQ